MRATSDFGSDGQRPVRVRRGLDEAPTQQLRITTIGVRRRGTPDRARAPSHKPPRHSANRGCGRQRRRARSSPRTEAGLLARGCIPAPSPPAHSRPGAGAPVRAPSCASPPSTGSAVSVAKPAAASSADPDASAYSAPSRTTCRGGRLAVPRAIRSRATSSSPPASAASIRPISSLRGRRHRLCDRNGRRALSHRPPLAASHDAGEQYRRAHHAVNSLGPGFHPALQRR